MQKAKNSSCDINIVGERPHKRLFLAAALASSLLVPLAVGQTFSIPNHSFESGTGYWAASSWTNDYHPGPTAGSGLIEVANASVSGKDGSNFVRILAENGNPNGGPTDHYLYSADLGTYAANTEYTLTVSIAKPANATNQSAGIGLRANGDVELLEYYAASTDLGTSFSDYTITLDTADNPSLVGQTISIVLALEHAGNYFRGMLFDNVRLEGSSSAPPPSSSISITNPSFEAGTGYWAASGWTNSFQPGPTGGSGVVEVANAAIGGKDGNNFVRIQAENGNPHNGTTHHYLYSENLGTYAADTEYTLTVAVAKPTNATNQSAGIGLRANGNVEVLDFYAASTDLNTSFSDFTVTLDTSADPSLVGQTISVVLALEHNDNYYRGMLFDNVRLVTGGGSSEPPPPPPSDFPLMGMGLNGISYWAVSDPFVEVSRLAARWISFPAAGGAWDDQRSIPLRSDGYPASLLSDQAARSLVFTHNGQYFPIGEYVLTWEGDGVIRLAGSPNTIVSDQPGRRVVNVTSTSANGLFIEILETNPSDPIRDINLWLPGYENATSIFNPILLDNIAPFAVLRFMDWGRTNNSPLEHWADRTHVGDAHYSSATGVPYELMIDLSNQTGKDLWICVPHRATDAFVSEMAKLVRDNLDPSIRVWVEYSNEVWNWIFAQSQYNLGLADAMEVNYAYHYGLRSAEIFDIFEQEFGSLDRIIRVVAGHAASGNGWVLQQALMAADGRADVGSIASYFTRSSTVDLMWDERDTITYDEIFDAIDSEIVGAVKNWWQNNLARCDAWDIPMVAYEGGPHLVGNNAQQRGDSAFVQFIASVNRHPRMYDSYRIALDQWFDLGGSTWVSFVESGGWGASGYWGHKEYGSQPISEATKYRALIEWLEDQD